ncbi:hypothetical protein [Cryptosporangium phraense]|uniref:hypothetical protein n=1 Tax=Cryptosporangium phraense TaxID=2593070 RepID=UPI00197AEA9D|nr:hypothetical protein [Cryptosporangium phraense]
MPEDRSDLDVAFAQLKSTAPVLPPPGPEAARRTVARRRRARRGWFALAAVVVVLAGAGVGWLLSLEPPSDTARITAGSRPSAGLSPAGPSSSASGPLLDVTQLRFYDGVPLVVPERAGGCPAATVRFAVSSPTVTVGGVEYTLYGGSAFTDGDLTGDGHAEQAIAIVCRQGGSARSELLVVGAVSATRYETVAAGPVELGEGDFGLRIEGGAVVVYRSHQDFSAANRLGSYRLDGKGGFS